MMLHAAASLLIVTVSGCSSGRTISSPTWTCSITSTEITLSRTQPEDPMYGIRLVHIRSDGRVTLRAIRSGKTYSAAPGGYFAGEDFGQHGVLLVSASSRSGTAVLERTWSEH
jgi:hypothetical protein